MRSTLWLGVAWLLGMWVRVEHGGATVGVE